jgi:hypothetical protein
MTWDDCVLSYFSHALYVTAPNTLRGIVAGPGSKALSGRSVRGDVLWVHSSSFKQLLEVHDTTDVALTGTITTTGSSSIVTGTGTKFLEELTKIGTIDDLIVINGTKYAISSIETDTRVIVTGTPPAVTGAVAYRYNLQNAVEYDFTFSALGEPNSNALSKQLGRAVYGSKTNISGDAVLLSGTTSIVVTHNARRVPVVGEIQVTPHSVTDGRTWSVSDITATTFKININSTAASDYTFGWTVNLGALN